MIGKYTKRFIDGCWYDLLFHFQNRYEIYPPLGMQIDSITMSIYL